eukprot:1140740-Pelagomonas_calceolata.AAC.3
MQGFGLQPETLPGRLLVKHSQPASRIGTNCHAESPSVHILMFLKRVIRPGLPISVQQRTGSLDLLAGVATRRECLGRTRCPDQLQQVCVTSGTRHPWHKARDNRNSAKPQWKMEQRRAMISVQLKRESLPRKDYSQCLEEALFIRIGSFPLAGIAQLEKGHLTNMTLGLEYMHKLYYTLCILFIWTALKFQWAEELMFPAIACKCLLASTEKNAAPAS